MNMLQYKWPVMGHTKPLRELEADLRQGRLSHAYLFDGPEKIGKRLVARTFAQILQCANHFCRTCGTCRQIEKGQHLDTIELLDDGESLKIDQIRELMTHLSTTHSGRYKIVFIQNLDRIVPEAANTLLKTLEEPISGVIFLMTCSQSHRLLDTLLSRARLISFHALPESVIEDYLKKMRPDLDAVTLEMMAGFSMGRPGRAVGFLNDPDTFRLYQDTYNQVVTLLNRSTVTERMMVAEEVSRDDPLLQAFLELFLHVVRGFTLKKLRGVHVPYAFDQLFAMVDHLNEARFQLDHNVNSRMVLESLMLKI